MAHSLLSEWQIRHSRRAPLTNLYTGSSNICVKDFVFQVMRRGVLILAGLLGTLYAQAPAARSFVATVVAFKPETLEMDVKSDSGETVRVSFNTETLVQRVAPGEKDLRNVSPIRITDVAIGDRLLVSLAAGTKMARRIVVMSATDISKRNEQDREDWMKRGVSGIVASKSGNQVTLKMRSMGAETQAVVTVTDKTRFRRYAPDSVRFADAKTSSLAEVRAGDQLRARGEKSEDGVKVAAEEIVFGTFLTKAGTVTAVDAEAKRIVVKDMVTNKPLTIHLTADSQLKAMPNFGGMMGARGGPGGPPGGGPPGGGRPGGFDLSQMLERMPAAKLEDLKPGQTVVVSSTKGATSDEVTAITVLANADFLIQMATRQQAGRGGGRPDALTMGPSMGMGGLAGGLEGLGMPGMIP